MATLIETYLDRLCCPGCGADLALETEQLVCSGCGHAFELGEQIPRLFWPNEWGGDHEDVTERIRAFYEETPFPNYDELDSAASLLDKARKGLFARQLDDQVPPGALVLECGCGTGQLSSFLSIANRTVFGTDICLNSLRLAQGFKEANDLTGVQFLQMNLFRPAFKPETFDLVISNGVLHHTSAPRLAFEGISRLVRPGGFLLVGLYHRYGRLITDLRRQIFRLTGGRFDALDPTLRHRRGHAGRWEAWFRDQYQNPHESKHTIGEVMGWAESLGLHFVSSAPGTKLLQSSAGDRGLFDARAPGGAIERRLAELAMAFKGSREGGFFVVIARKPAAAG